MQIACILNASKHFANIILIMIKSKLNSDKKVLIVQKVNVPATLRNIPYGREVHFLRSELANRDATVFSAVSRLNKEAGKKEFNLRIDDNDGSYWILRK